MIVIGWSYILIKILILILILIHRIPSRYYSADKAPIALMEDETYNRSPNRDMQIVQIGLLRVIEYRTYTIL